MRIDDDDAPRYRAYRVLALTSRQRQGEGKKEQKRRYMLHKTYDFACKITKNNVIKQKNLEKSAVIQENVVPLHPLFGVIAGRKSRVACYVALER